MYEIATPMSSEPPRLPDQAGEQRGIEQALAPPLRSKNHARKARRFAPSSLLITPPEPYSGALCKVWVRARMPIAIDALMHRRNHGVEAAALDRDAS